MGKYNAMDRQTFELGTKALEIDGDLEQIVMRHRDAAEVFLEKSCGLDRFTPLSEAVKLIVASGSPSSARARALLARSERTRWDMVNLISPVVLGIARKYLPTLIADGVDLKDLLQIGRIGAFEGAKRFNPDRDATFRTYAAWWIRAGITRDGRSKEVSSGGREQWRNILKAQSIGLSSDEDIAAFVGIRASRVRELRVITAPTVSLDAPTSSDDGGRIVDLVVDPDHSYETVVDAVDDQRHLDRITTFLARLPERQRKILALRYGLDGAEPLTLSEVGKCFETRASPRRGKKGEGEEHRPLSRERVRQLEKEALMSLRRMFCLRPDATPIQWNYRLRDHIVACVRRNPGVKRETLPEVVCAHYEDVYRELEAAVEEGLIEVYGRGAATQRLFVQEKSLCAK